MCRCSLLVPAGAARWRGDAARSPLRCNVFLWVDLPVPGGCGVGVSISRLVNISEEERKDPASSVVCPLTSSETMERKVNMIKGFYPFLDKRQLEFLTSVDEIMSCELCNTITKSYYVAKCRHFFCPDCYSLIQKETSPKCPLDNIDWELKTSCCLAECSLNYSRVRCPNTGYGCEYVDYLDRMNDHVGYCAFYPLPCIKCGITVGYNNLVSHLLRSCKFRGNETADPKPAVLDAVE